MGGAFNATQVPLLNDVDPDELAPVPVRKSMAAKIILTSHQPIFAFFEIDRALLLIECKEQNQSELHTTSFPRRHLPCVAIISFGIPKRDFARCFQDCQRAKYRRHGVQ